MDMGTAEENQQDSHNVQDFSQMSFSPYLEAYLMENETQKSCGCLPMLFERAAPYSCIRPCFDSDILEQQFRNSSCGYFTKRFRCGLFYLIAVYTVWIFYSIFNLSPLNVGLFALLTLLSSGVYYLTYQQIYVNHPVVVAFMAALIVISGALSFFLIGYSSLSRFATANYVILVIFTIFPLPPYASLSINLIFSACYLVIEYFKADSQIFEYGLFIRFMCLLCVQILGLHVSVMTHARMRGTFMKVGQRLLVRRQLESEKQLKEKMIYSAMPPKVAGWLLDNEKTRESENSTGDISSLFRPFTMCRMTDVSILFADIVGFTRMSSNKTAEEIVDILNDLFERFDILCSLNGCEKISTLGDCYYCVAGCPEPKTDHAVCCVEMGLGMIEAIKEFDQEREENVNMRVGIHTGTVLCGVVGSRRFKFDVWSNDVTLANRLESTGQPGRVHVSEQTRNFLVDRYTFEDYQSDLDVKSYLVMDRKFDKQIPPHVRVSMPYAPPPMIDRSVSVSAKTSPKKPPHYLNIINDVKSKFSSLPNMFESSKQGLTRKSASIKSQFSYPSHQQRQQEPLIEVTVKKSELKPVTSEELLSLCPSATSRKDSGIKSASRRSSIQPQMPLLPEATTDCNINHRTSGYFTCSEQSSSSGSLRLPVSLRKQSDLQFIRCVQDMVGYVARMPMRRWTLKFNRPEVEKEWRSGWSWEEGCGRFLYSHRFNAFFDTLISSLVLLVTTIGINMLTPQSSQSLLLLPLSILAMLSQIVIIVLSLLSVSDRFSRRYPKVPDFLSRWYLRHFIGSFLLALPIVLVLIYSCLSLPTFHCDDVFQFPLPQNIDIPYYYFLFIFLTGISHFCNFSQLNFLSKFILSVLCVIPALILPLVASFGDSYAVLSALGQFLTENFFSINVNGNLTLSVVCGLNISTNISNHNYFEIGRAFTAVNSSCGNWYATEAGRYFLDHSSYAVSVNWREIVLILFTMSFLVLIVNRESEINYRSSFYFNVESNRDKVKVLYLKNQADLLLGNIIPKHVTVILKAHRKYCQNHTDIAIIFANIVNFNQLYEESYSGGKEYLRYLNELISDFDELLDKFKNVDKIKTIGSCYMAASGLNPEIRKMNKYDYDHIVELMEFTLELQKVVNNFNKNLFGFRLDLRVGFNVGDVTAGVIGSSRLLFDIWGDTVNVASRMDSTGIINRIQLPYTCLRYFPQDKYKFESRGSVFVKGKGNITCYLLKNEL